MPVYQIVSKQRLLGQEIRNVFYYETTLVLDTAMKQEVTDAFRESYFNLDTSAAMAGQWEWYALDIRQVDVADLPSAEFTPTLATVVGGSVSDPVPAQVAMLGRVTGDTAFPRNTRIYQGGWTESHIGSSGRFGTSVTNALDLFLIDTLQVVISGDTLNRVAVHWDTVNNVVDDWNPVSNISVSNNPVIQRRRRLGSGI